MLALAGWLLPGRLPMIMDVPRIGFGAVKRGSSGGAPAAGIGSAIDGAAHSQLVSIGRAHRSEPPAAVHVCQLRQQPSTRPLVRGHRARHRALATVRVVAAAAAAAALPRSRATAAPRRARHAQDMAFHQKHVHSLSCQVYCSCLEIPGLSCCRGRETGVVAVAWRAPTRDGNRLTQLMPRAPVELALVNAGRWLRPSCMPAVCFPRPKQGR